MFDKVKGERKYGLMESSQENEENEEKPQKWTSWDNPVLTPEQWQEVRRAVEAGLSMPDAAKTWQIDYETVKKRAQREEWLTESRIKALAEQLKAKETLKIENANKSLAVPTRPKIEKRPENALQAVSESLEGYRSRTLLGLAKLAEKGVSEAIAADLPVENWQDAKIAADIAMKLHQVGQESVQVNICNAFADMDEGRVAETEAEVIESEDERGSYFVDNE